MEWLPLLAALIGAAAGSGLLGPIVTARHHRADWLRDKRAELYGEVAEALQAVLDVVNYDDQINLSLGNEMSDERYAAWQALDRVTARLKVYGSPRVGALASDLRDLLRAWDNAPWIPDLEQGYERVAQLSPQDPEGDPPLRHASPLDEDFPHERVGELARSITQRDAEIVSAIRDELDVPGLSLRTRILRR